MNERKLMTGFTCRALMVGGQVREGLWVLWANLAAANGPESKANPPWVSRV